jgi:fatty acid-binding protein DegV
MKKKFAIIIDSSTTYDEKFVDDNNVYIIPMQFSDSNGATFDDDENFTQEKMIDELKNGKVFKSSYSNTGKFIKLIETLLVKYEDVYFIPISYGISGQ